MNCPYCNGTGVVHLLVNRESLTDPMEEPIYERDACEECGGTGEIETHKQDSSK